MGVVQQINSLVWSWAEMLRAFRNRVALVPFLIYAAAQTALLLMVVGFTAPPFNLFVPGLLRWRLGEQALHYPNNLLALRSVLGDADILFSIFLGALVTAAAAHLFSSFYSGSAERFSVGWRAGAARYTRLIAVALVVAAISVAVVRIPMTFWGDLADTRPLRFRLLRMMLVGAVLVIQTLFVYALPSIVIDGKRVLASLRGSVALALRNPITTFLIVAVPASLELLPAWLMRNSAVIVYRFSPEFLAVAMLIWIAALFFIGYATVGAATRFYLHATADESPVTGEGGQS